MRAKIKDKIFPICLVIMLAAMILGFVVKEAPVTKVTIYNPYSVSVSMEVKCDYDNKKKAFLYYKKFTIKKKDSFKVRLPKSLKECQIWPKVL